MKKLLSFLMLTTVFVGVQAASPDELKYQGFIPGEDLMILLQLREGARHGLSASPGPGSRGSNHVFSVSPELGVSPRAEIKRVLLKRMNTDAQAVNSRWLQFELMQLIRAGTPIADELRSGFSSPLSVSPDHED